MKVYIVTTKSKHTGVETIEAVFAKLGDARALIKKLEVVLNSSGEGPRFSVFWTEEEVQ
jgi:hypothetical protein